MVLFGLSGWIYEVKCCIVCRECMVNWIDSQIGDGNSISLSCVCWNTKLNYNQILPFFPQLFRQSTEILEEARRLEIPKGYHKITCLDCANDIWITDHQHNTPCSNPLCCSSRVLICAKHLIKHSRVDSLSKKESRRCWDVLKSVMVMVYLLQ